jgi:tRNA(Arg) A34 adenosine deaminase TadA
MCFTAAWWARISRIVYGMEAEDVTKEDWKIDIKCNELNKRSGNKIEIKGSVLREECKKLLKLIK